MNKVFRDELEKKVEDIKFFKESLPAKIVLKKIIAVYMFYYSQSAISPYFEPPTPSAIAKVHFHFLKNL